MRRGVGIGVVALIAAVTWLCAALLLRWWFRTGLPLPQATWSAVAVVLTLALAVVAVAWPVRRALRGRSPRPVAAGRALRTLVLAQASAITGSLVVGWHLGLAAVLAPDADAASVRDSLVRALAVAVAGVVLLATGLWGQRCCRLPDDEQRPPQVA